MNLSSPNHIETTPSVCGGKPCIAGTRIRVYDIYVWHELRGQSVDEIVSNFPQLTLGKVHAALAYYHEHRDELQEQMRADRELAESLRTKLPSRSIEENETTPKPADADSLPSR